MGIRIGLVLTGAAVSVGALGFWIWLNAMASAYRLADGRLRLTWLSEEALVWFWLPFAAGIAIAVGGWRRR